MQQCAEKALKGYLAYQKQPLQKTHDIEMLIKFCEDLDKTFDKLLEASVLLTPYATIYRYPDIIVDPDDEEIRVAIASAQNILEFVKKKII